MEKQDIIQLLNEIFIPIDKEFKKVFGETAKRYDFERAYGGWFKESQECIVALDLQKSNYSNLNYLNIEIYVQGMFAKTYIKNKDLLQ